jgi:hypothetical protein
LVTSGTKSERRGTFVPVGETTGVDDPGLLTEVDEADTVGSGV